MKQCPQCQHYIFQFVYIYFQNVYIVGFDILMQIICENISHVVLVLLVNPIRPEGPGGGGNIAPLTFEKLPSKNYLSQ